MTEKLGANRPEVAIAKISGSRELDLDILITHPKFSDLPVFENPRVQHRGHC
jgi:hypothetical protein